MIPLLAIHNVMIGPEILFCYRCSGRSARHQSCQYHTSHVFIWRSSWPGAQSKTGPSVNSFADAALSQINVHPHYPCLRACIPLITSLATFSS